MTARPIVPLLRDLPRRLPEAGRLRTGVRTTKAFKAIPTWRATSADEEAIRQIAAVYGGTPAPWADAPTPGQWEVITEASELQVVLPPDPLGNTPVYELWSGGGCQRRCDGETAEVVGTGPDGPEMHDTPCVCVAEGVLACRPITRLSVILPDVRFGGTWRYQSSTSRHVAIEMPAMVQLIQSLQERGLTRAALGIESRKEVRFGQTRRYTIPVLKVPRTLDELAAGAARVAAVAPADRPESIGAPQGAIPATAAVADDSDDGVVANTDDMVVEAEVVDDPPALPASVTSFCSICHTPYGDGPLRRGTGSQSKYVHVACAETAP